MLTSSKQSSSLLTTVCSFCDKILIHFNCTQLSHITLSLKRSKMWIHNWPQPQAFRMFERQGVGSWGVWVLDTFSFTVYDPGQEDFNFPSNHSSRGPLSEEIHRQQSNLSFQGLVPTIPLSVPIWFTKRFPYSTFHESTAKSANLCQFLLYSAERFPFLPWVAQGCSGF